MAIIKLINPCVVLVLLLFLSTGCSGQNEPALSAVKADSVYLGLCNERGAKIELKAAPQRIVSLSLRSDEILLALVGPGRMAALSYWVDDPLISNVTGEAQAVPARVTASAENIIEMQPDLVVAAQSQPYDLINSLRSLGVPVYVMPTPRVLQDAENLIFALGKVVREEAKAEELVAGMRLELAAIGEKVAKIPPEKRVLVYRVSISGGSGGRNSFFNDVCRLAGVDNAAAKMQFGGTQLMPKEQIVQFNPDVILLPTWDYSGKVDVEQYKQDIIDDPALQTVTAIKNRRLYVIEDKYMLASSQYMVEAVRDIFEACYEDK